MKATRKLKIFLSYCSKDTIVKDDILKFVMPMVECNAEIWHDKKLLSGDKFDDSIKEKLEESDIFLFLITQDFLSSSYCRDVEMDTALMRKATEEDMRIIPIILDYCTFTDSKLAPYNATPSKAKPISSYLNKNEAYYEVAKAISDVVDYMKQKFADNTSLIVNEPELQLNEVKADFREYLNDLGFTIQHSNKDIITLDDLFVYPDLKRLKYDFEDYDVYRNSKDALKAENVIGNHTLIIGDEQSGKSTLAKVLFKNYHAEGFIPILLKGDALKKTGDFQEVIQRVYSSQYESAVIDSDKIVLIIDDITESPINERYKRLLVANLKKTYKSLLVIADSKLRFSEQLLKDFDSFNKYDISHLGHTQRTEFVEKWNSIGIEESACLYEQQSVNDNLKRNIDSILMKNIVPSKPIFLLMILQILESNTPNNFALSSYGHCYHSLIVQAFSKANVRVDEMSDYFNYLGELSFFIFSKGNAKIYIEQLEEFKNDYSSNYYVSSHEEILSKLVKSRLITIDVEKVSFQYKYIFYFFVAKKISDMSGDECSILIDDLSRKIHTEKHANILIFITHHTKDKMIIDRICENLRGIFSDREEATLNKKNVSFLNEMAGEIPKIVIDKSKDVERERKNSLAELDRNDRIEEYHSRRQAALNLDFDDMEEEDVHTINKELVDVNRSYKAVEILGQIIRNRKGSLPIPQLEKLGIETYSVGFRFLNFYYSITSELKDEIIEEVHRIMLEKKHWSTERVTKEARLFYWTYSYMMSLNVIRKISYSIGHKDLMIYYEKLSEYFGSEISKLVEISIKLEFTKKIPKDEITNIWPVLKDNLMTRRLLQEIVITHLHMHYTNHEDRAWIATKLSIPIKDQINLQKNTALPAIK